MTKTIISTTGAPRAIGPYSQAVKVGSFVFTAGQIALDPETGQLVAGDIAVQTHRVMRNLQAVLEAAGASLDRVVKTTCFLADLADFAAFNAVYAEYFPENPPARSTVQAARLPADASVEVECVAECG
ncbi:RidA family protein [Nitrolancea hollandica]|uniref:Putative enzyme resulting in alteration of gene expression n=1 Tax=Nitrolancea hollandica Lb TaxID=1129897 RepID=I4EC97_9BACT|nr:RidA family protein [Nitrolancea hollandica]CCF82309.1 putative enzyme resulting in alteration of gene expression [Nitrolancea hollandica Lb]